MHNKATRTLLNNVRSSLNHQIAVNEFANALLICCCGLVIVCLLFIIRGYGVEIVYLAIPPVITLVFAVVNYRKKCYNVKQVAAYSDRYFEFHDALVSLLDFENQPILDGFHKRHIAVTETLCAATDCERLRLQVPWQRIIISCLIGGIAIVLTTMDDSPVITNARNRKQQTVQISEKINRELQHEFKRFAQKLSPTEKKLLKKSKFGKLVNDLKSRSEFKAAMRQYAKLEKALNKLSANQQFKSNSQLLNEIARQLLKHNKTNKLGQYFNRGHYRRALEHIRQLKIAGDKQKNLEQLKQVLEKIKKAAEQLIANDSKLKEQFSALKAAIDKYDKAMQKYKKAGTGDLKKALSKGEQEATEQLDNLSEALEKQQVSESFINKLMKMRSAMQRAQQKMRRIQQGTGMKGQKGAPMRGQGKQAGLGVGSATAGNRRKAGDEATSNGKLSKIIGQQGSGSTLKNIKNAMSGSAISRRVNIKTNNEFSYKMEEFIRRNDVPEQMKSGVKRYFSDLHRDDR